MRKKTAKTKSRKIAASAVRRNVNVKEFNKQIRTKYKNDKLTLVKAKVPYIRGFVEKKDESDLLKELRHELRAEDVAEVKTPKRKIPKRKRVKFVDPPVQYSKSVMAEKKPLRVHETFGVRPLVTDYMKKHTFGVHRRVSDILNKL